MQQYSIAQAIKIIHQNILYDNKDKPFLIAIDGRCTAGKTTLAQALAKQLSCDVIHMDDFFLQPHQRTLERYSEPGGNVDHERFEKEVLIPMKNNKEISYQKYDCRLQKLTDRLTMKSGSIFIIEGSYSMHPSLNSYYDLSIFLDVNPEKQMERIRKRNGEEMLKIFQSKWIPLEEVYFETCQIKEKCQLCFQLNEK